MPRTVHCAKLNTEAAGLAKAPYPGELGQRIYKHISQQGWDMWLAHQTMLINEYKLSLIDPKSREFLTKAMQDFLFGDENTKPPGFVPLEDDNA